MNDYQLNAILDRIDQAIGPPSLLARLNHALHEDAWAHAQDDALFSNRSAYEVREVVLATLDSLTVLDRDHILCEVLWAVLGHHDLLGRWDAEGEVITDAHLDSHHHGRRTTP
jgi:hypothetical protein